MDDSRQAVPLAARRKRQWLWYVLIILLLEKVVQHVVVTLAFVFDWMHIASTVVVDPKVLAVLGGLAAVLYGVALWGMLRDRDWAPLLVVGLALFDIVGEFVAQGTFGITITVSFLVATVILVLAFLYRRAASKGNA